MCTKNVTMNFSVDVMHHFGQPSQGLSIPAVCLTAEIHYKTKPMKSSAYCLKLKHIKLSK